VATGGGGGGNKGGRGEEKGGIPLTSGGRSGNVRRNEKSVFRKSYAGAASVIHARAGEEGGGVGMGRGGRGKELGGKCKRILSRSMKHADVRYSDIYMDTRVYVYTRVPRAPAPRTLSWARDIEPGIMEFLVI